MVPPKIKPAVCVPALPPLVLAVFKLFPSVQDEPLYSSDALLKLLGPVVPPPAASAAV